MVPDRLVRFLAPGNVRTRNHLVPSIDTRARLREGARAASSGKIRCRLQTRHAVVPDRLVGFSSLDRRSDFESTMRIIILGFCIPVSTPEFELGGHAYRY